MRLVVPLAAIAMVGLALPAVAQQGSTVLDETQFCADLGRKQPGEAVNTVMAEHIAERLAAAGLEVDRETFHVPVFDVVETVIEVLEPAPSIVPGDAFAYSGTGTVDGEVVYVGVGRESDYAGVDATGKIVMVDRELTFHRSAQLNEVVAHGGAAMLYVSAAPDNLVQVGTVRFAQHPRPDIPTVTVGADDGSALADLASAGGLRMRITVDADINDAIGVNVIGTKVGATDPEHVILVGGHYDSWYDGAVDNCSGIGSMLQIVERVADDTFPYTVMFGAWDGEEIGLVGSYDFVMKHQDLMPRILVNENLEMTSAASQQGDFEAPLALVNLLFGTTGPALNAVVAESAARTGHIAAPTTANGVRYIQGGIIPTDLQPFYSQGVQGFSTFSNSAYYHTTEDTPEHIPDYSHEAVTEFLEAFLRDVQNVPPEGLLLREVPEVRVEVPATAWPGEDLEVLITVTDVLGQPVTGQRVQFLVNERDHWPVLLEDAAEVGDGIWTFTVPGEKVTAGRLWFTATLNEDLYAAEGYGWTDVTGVPVEVPAPVAPTPTPPSSLPVTGGGIAIAGLGLAAMTRRRRRA